ncbi:hypothetical protein ABBQ32_008053 [Trebouxia sp. C0010 RCD-2024]
MTGTRSVSAWTCRTVVSPRIGKLACRRVCRQPGRWCKPTASMASSVARARRNDIGTQAITHCLFDMDGLLLNTEDLYTLAQEEVLAPFGKKFTWDLKASTMGMKAIPASNLVVETLGLQGQLTPEQFLANRERILHKTFASASLLPGAERLLRHLHQNGVPICLATSSDAFNFNLKTTHHKPLFNEVFHHKVTGDMIENGKPAPDIFLHAAKGFEPPPDPSTCLVFEDAPNGVKAGKAAGMFVVMVPDPNMEEKDTLLADEVLNSLQDFDPAHWGLPPFSE